MPISKIANHWVGYLGVNGEEVEVKPMAWWLGLQRERRGHPHRSQHERLGGGDNPSRHCPTPPPLPCHRQSEQPGYSSVRKDGGSGVESCEAAGPILCEGEGDDAP
uniref:Uncharacterized protein n=1 Tax=Oryza rufipogon TaxID=4529 RepID=A0A0E0QZQ0_ORYRU